MGKLNNKPNGKQNSKTNSFKGKGRGNKRVRNKDVTTPDEREKMPTTDRDNDWTWYASNEYLLRDSASLPYNNQAGIPISLDGWKTETREQFPSQLAFPGVLGIELVPTPGAAYDPVSPVNIAARNIFSYTRHENSGSGKNYDSPNQMMYILAMDSLYSTYSHLARMYGLIRTYAIRNRYLPRTLFTACGWDYDDFMVNQAQYRYWLNTLVEKIGAMCVPAKMTFMKRHMWLFQNVFADAQSDKAQFYFYYPRVMWKYDGLSVPADADLAPNSVSGPVPGLKALELCTPSDGATQTLRTFADVQAIVDYAIESILSSEDLNIMSGDILKAFKPEGIWRLLPIHEDFEVKPVYSLEVLTQIHNLRASGVPTRISGSSSFDTVTWLGRQVNASKAPFVFENVLADGGYSFVRTSPTISGSLNSFYGNKYVIDMPIDDVAPADTMVATRLMTVLSNMMRDGSDTLRKVATGSEVVSRCMMWLLGSGGVPVGKLYPTDIMFNPATDVATIRTLLQTEMMAAKFDMAPMRAYYYNDTQAKTITPWYLGSDITNFTVVDADVMYRMHETALLNMFRVPQMGAWTGGDVQ